MEDIKKVFFNRRSEMIGEYRKSSVLILLQEENGEVYVIFEVRALTLKHQPGDVCLPGGKIEKDENPKDTAFRETCEELNVKMEDLEYLGEMDYFISPYGSIMYSFIAKLNSNNIEPNKSEVDHIFKIPLKFFIDKEPELHIIHIKPHIEEDFPYNLIRDGRDYKFSSGKMLEYFYVYEDYVIWGFTAIIIKSFIDIIKDKKI